MRRAQSGTFSTSGEMGLFLVTSAQENIIAKYTITIFQCDANDFKLLSVAIACGQ